MRSRMSPEIISIIALAVMFVVATIFPVNMGALAFVAAFLVGTLAVGMETPDILAAFPGDLFLTIVGVTYLFAIAQNNGTIDLLVRGAVRLVRGRIALIPWVMFFVTALITAMGALSPAAVAIIAPIALGFAAKYRINTLMMGMFVIHGAQAGGFSPIAVYGVTVNTIMAGTPLEQSPTAVFLASLFFNLGIAVVLFFLFGGRKLFGAKAEHFDEAVAGSRQANARGGDVDLKGFGSGMYGSRDPAGGTAVATTVATRKQLLPQVLTIVGLVALGVIALGFKVNVGFVAITIAVVLALVSPEAQKGAVNKISWSTVLLVCGMLTFVGVLQAAGTIEYVSEGVANIGVPLIVALLICYIGAVVSAFASSTAIIAVLIPLAVPFLLDGNIGAIGVICALAVSATIVDVSPFSTNGALVLANAPDADKDGFYKRILTYSAVVVLVGPILAWLVFVVPGWL
jgi:di/tricarboxylate transporter